MSTRKSRKREPNEHNTLTREIIETACKKTGATRKGLMVALVPHGVNYSSTHGVFYCYIKGSQGFTDRLVQAVGQLTDSYAANVDAKVVAVQERERRANAELRKMRRAVEAMCIACAAPEAGETPRCWDGTCPLRSVSPLPLAVRK